MATSITLLEPHSERLVHLASISPKNGPKYSPNLYRWMRSRKSWWRDQVVAYRDTKTDLLYLGYFDEVPSDWLSAAMLNRILGVGSAATVCAYRNHDFEMVPGFWSEYVRLGRCRVDPDHRQYFIGDETRWVYDGEDVRYCAWCGECRQVRTQKRVTQTIEVWESMEAGR